MIFCAAAAFVPRTSSKPAGESHVSAAPPPARPTSPAGVAQGGAPAARGPLRVVRFNLYDAGIYPREVHVDSGLVAISIEDYSGGTTGLVVERENGNAPERLGRVERAGPHWRGRSEMMLEPGNYWLYMAERPDNRALLVVEP